jgi:hypothetical protein
MIRTSPTNLTPAAKDQTRADVEAELAAFRAKKAKRTVWMREYMRKWRERQKGEAK